MRTIGMALAAGLAGLPALAAPPLACRADAPAGAAVLEAACAALRLALPDAGEGVAFVLTRADAHVVAGHLERDGVPGPTATLGRRDRPLPADPTPDLFAPLAAALAAAGVSSPADVPRSTP